MPTNFLPRLGVLLLGITLLSFGIALAIRSNMGTSPVSSLPYVYSFITSFSVGTLTLLVQLLMIVAQMLILGKNFHWYQWFQLPASVFFGFMIDAMLWLTQGWTPESYSTQLMICLGNCVITAIAVCLMIKANLIVMAVDAMYLAICERWKLSFGKCKMWGDISLIVLAVVSIWLYQGSVIGIREGTLISAVLVGNIIRILMPYFDWFDLTSYKDKNVAFKTKKPA